MGQANYLLTMVAIETIISPRSMPPAGIVQRIAKERESKSPPNEGAVSSRASQIDAAANYRGKLAQAKAMRRAKNSITPPPTSLNDRQPPTTSNAAVLGNASTPIYRLRNNPSPSPPTLHHKNGNHQSLPRSTPPLTPQTIHHHSGNHQRSLSGGINPSWMNEDAKEMSQVDLFGNKIRSDTSHPTNVRIYPDQDAANSIDVSTLAPSNGSVGGNIEVAYHVGLPNLLSNDDDTVKSSATHDEFTDTEFYKRFDEAFNMTLRNNPGILPGASTVIDSIRQSMFKVKKAAAQTEKEMRMRLEKVNSEKNQLEAQLRAEMGKDAMRRNELTKELAARTEEKDVLQESLTKQIEAVEAVKCELTAKAHGVTKEREELQTHLRLLSKSRVELEAALETEMKAVQRDRDDLSKILAERKKLQQQKEDNKDLEKKIEHMTEAAQKEKLTLQAEVAELKSFEEHIAEVRKENEEVRKALEQEKRQLKELAETMQLKKMSAMESLKDLESQFQEEIDDINGKIERAKMMHEKDVESIIKSRVMTYLREGRRDETVNEPVNQVFSQDEVVQVASQDIEQLIRERVEAELKKKMETDRSNSAEYDQKLEAERIKAVLKRQIDFEMEQYEAELKRKMEVEAEFVKEELSRKLEAESAAAMLKRKQMETELIDAELRKKRLELERFEDEQNEKKENEARKANLRTISVQTSTMEKEDTMREEIDRLREDLQMIQSRNPRHSLSSPIQPRRDDIVLQEIKDLRNEIALSSPGIKSPRVTFHRNNSLGSPRYGTSRLHREEEEENDVRLNRNSLPYTPPRAQRSPKYRGEEESEMRMQRKSSPYISPRSLPPLRQRNASSRSGYYF